MAVVRVTRSRRKSEGMIELTILWFGSWGYWVWNFQDVCSGKLGVGVVR